MRSLLRFVSPLVALWVLVSFGGAMFDPARADFWTQSLMGSLIAALLVGPLFLFGRNQRSDDSSSSAAADPSSSARTQPTRDEASPEVNEFRQSWAPESK